MTDDRMTIPRQAAIDAMWDAMDVVHDTTSRREAIAALDYLDAHPEAAAALRAYLPGDDLGAAWSEAEAALPEGGELFVSNDVDEDDAGRAWGAEAAPRMRAEGPPPLWYGEPFQAQIAYGPTPAAALRALTTRLKEAEREAS